MKVKSAALPAVLVVALVSLFVWVTRSAEEPRRHTSLGASVAELRDAFNADVDKTRVVMLLSPTCGVCLRGARDVARSTFGEIEGDGLRGLVIWEPMLGGRSEHVPEATTLVPDPRARHFWDGGGLLLERYREVLDIDEPAWDVYMVYEPGIRWEGAQPPAPSFWMHQLGSPEDPRVDGPYLEADAFTSRVRAAVAAADPRGAVRAGTLENHRRARMVEAPRRVFPRQRCLTL